MKNFVLWSFARDESTNQKDTPQLPILVKRVNRELNETEELLSLQSIKGTTAGANTCIYTEFLNAFETFGMHLTTLSGIATDDSRAMSGLVMSAAFQNFWGLSTVCPLKILRSTVCFLSSLRSALEK